MATPEAHEIENVQIHGNSTLIHRRRALAILTWVDRWGHSSPPCFNERVRNRHGRRCQADALRPEPRKSTPVICSAFIERIERLEEEKKALADDIKDVYGEAKANGFDTRIMRKVVSIRKQDRDKRIEEETILDL